MNLNDTLVFQKLSSEQFSKEPKVETRILSRKELVRITAAKISDKVFSKKFTLIRTTLSRIADPYSMTEIDPNVVNRLIASNGSFDPIIVDYNKNMVGINKIGFSPKAIVIEGRERFLAASMRGDGKIFAWVGDEVLDYVHACKDVKDINACGCGLKSEKKKTVNMREKTSMFMKGATSMSMVEAKKLHSSKGKNYKPRIEAVAPPGWEETVVDMKDDPEIDNPYALSWYMYDQGYQPKRDK